MELVWIAPTVPDGVRGYPEADILCKRLDHDSDGPRGGINPVDYGEAKRH